jgi:hypothetical protein
MSANREFRRAMRRGSFRGAAMVFLLAATWCSPASAYRPFEGTDAAVADTGELEVELQPAGFLKQGTDKTLVAPAWVVNIGISQGWEAVFQGQGQFPLGASDAPASFAGAGAFLKGVLREGSLQDKTGPSIATEFGALLPGINADSGLGASLAGIVSQRWEWTTVHFNVATALTRDQHADLFLGTIIEGPYKWKVRPVAEFFYENEFGASHTVSGLIGAIWQVNDKLSFDIGLRHALTNGRHVDEILAGLTFGLPLQSFAGAHR